MTSRLFIALDIPVVNLDNLIHHRDKIYGVSDNVKWENIEKLHITLKFLGDVGENVLALLINRLEEIEYKKISTSFSKYLFFKKNNKLRILSAGIDNNIKISEFHNLIEKECELVGFQKENRTFKPHVTLLRIKGTEDLHKLMRFNDHIIDDKPFEINSFSIINSELKPTGSEYIKVKSFKLI